MSPRTSLDFVSLLLERFHIFPLPLGPAEVEGSLDQGGEGQQQLAGHGQAPLIAPLRATELQLASSRLLLPLWCRTFSCLHSTSACTSTLLSLQNNTYYLSPVNET